MPMPTLDPLRFVPVVPVDPTHKVPMAEPGRFFSQDPANPDLADTFDPYVSQLLAGGSLRRACDVATADAKAAAEAAAEKAAAEAQAASDKAIADAKAAADQATKDAKASDAKTDGTKTDGTKTDATKPAA